MDLSTIYSKTPKGLRARASLIGGLSSHLMKVLTHVDGTSRAENILLKFDNLTPQQLTADLTKLEQEGYIRLATVTSAVDDSWALTINFEPMVVEEFQSEEALEISAETKKVQQQNQQLQAEKLAAEMQAQQAEAERLAAQQKADKKAQKARDKEKIKAEVKVKAHLEEESREQQRQQKEAAIVAEMARKKAEQEAAQIKAEAEAQLKAKQQALKIAEQQAVERAAKLAEETQRKAELKAREAAEHAEAAAEATAKENARIQIQRISREAEEAQRKADSEMKIKQETERLEALRLAKAVEEARQAEIKAQAQREASDAAEQEKIKAEAVALAAAKKAKLELEKIEQEKLEQANLEKQKLVQEALNQEKARIEIASVLRKAEDDRKNAVAQAKAEKLEAKRIAKAEQDALQQAERKAKEDAKQQAKDQKLKAQAEEKAKFEAAEAAKRDLAQIARFEAEQQATQEIDDLANQVDAEQSEVENKLKNTALEHSQTVQVAHAKLTAEEQANNASKENARLEMARIAEEANQARRQFIAQEHIAETKKNSPNKSLPILNDFAAAEAAEEAAFEVEEQVAEAEQKIRHTIERTAKKSAEDASRADIKNAAIVEAEAMASVHGKSKSFVSAKKIKQWLASVSKITFIYVPVLALVLLALLHFINLSALIKPIEQLLTESVGEPVEIKKVHASLWPQPHLVLEGVAIGSTNIKAVHVLPQATSLFQDIKIAKSLVIEGLNIEQANFSQPLSWVSNISQAKNLKVEQINLKNLTLAIRDLQLESFDGKVTLNATGALNSIDLVSSNNALSVMISPQAGDYEVVLKAANWALPFDQKIMFNSLNARAIASNNQITFSQIEGYIYGGNLTAKARLNWPDSAKQWVSTGDFKLANANAEQLLNTFGSAVVINGKLSLDGNFSNKAREASKLIDATNMNASFDVLQGSVQGIELARAVMSRGSQSLAGDSTSFDKLTGSLKFNQGQYQFAKLVLTSPQFNANGFINLNASQAITGRINADLAAQSRRLRANFGIVGRGRDLKSQ